ncbi:hypothetical protein BDA99DRAFT_518413 [Phascolomyces articulosus]|uniref:F-box domain-containing protein n=1 Tax=Phascolomyces articulosus TaxID=60185 RepID=A0AAD5PB85_9FUNG|nr:hypothetical protein BDA99DRAFT_518413 [Phascolomyces articulosus]
MTIQNVIHADFLNQLPFEINTKIFSWLNQRDCLNLMKASNTWKEIVPQYTHALWSHVSLTPGQIQKDNTLWELCIGNHVRKVTFRNFNDDKELHTAMLKLINHHCNKLETIEFIRCSTHNQDFLLEILTQLASSTTKVLSFIDHKPVLYFNRVMDSIPSLTHFTFIQSLYAAVNSDDFPQYSSIPLTQLKHLKLYMDSTEQFEPLLQRCPNLRVFDFGSGGGGTGGIFREPDMDKFFSWCPKLVFLRANDNTYLEYETLEDVMNRIDEDDDQNHDEPRLRGFMAGISEYQTPEKIGHYLIKNGKTLEHLTLTGHALLLRSNGAGWTPILPQIHAPRLHTFIARNMIVTDPSSIPTMIGHAPMMERLVLQHLNKINITQLVANSRNIKHLILTGCQLSYNSTQNNSNSNNNESLIVSLAKNNWTQLEYVRLDHTRYISQDLLMALTFSPKLHTLLILKLNYEDNGFCQFIQALGTRTNMESFQLQQDRRYFPHDALRAFALFPHLRTLYITNALPELCMDRDALVWMLEESKSLQRVTIERLRLTTLDEGQDHLPNASISYLRNALKSYTVRESLSGVGYVCNVLFLRNIF